MDKFGSHSRKRMPVWRMLQDLDMNDHRITRLGLPQDSSDAVTKRWVNLQLKDNVKDIDDLEAELGAIQKALEAEKKRFDRIEKYMAKCLPMVGGKMEGDIDMQGHAIHNLPEGTRADEPVTKGWYAKNWQDLVVSMQGKINALEGKVKSYHTADRSKRDLGLEDELESGRVKPPPSTEDEIVVTGFSLLP